MSYFDITFIPHTLYQTDCAKYTNGRLNTYAYYQLTIEKYKKT